MKKATPQVLTIYMCSSSCALAALSKSLSCVSQARCRRREHYKGEREAPNRPINSLKQNFTFNTVSFRARQTGSKRPKNVNGRIHAKRMETIEENSSGKLHQLLRYISNLQNDFTEQETRWSLSKTPLGINVAV